MSIAARVFVALIFLILSASFIAPTAALYYEFGANGKATNWLTFAAVYSHLFLFFPTFGILALAAFYVPCCAFTDMYWKHVPFGALRFGFWFVTLIALSAYGAHMLDSAKVRSIWEVKPEVLNADKGQTLEKCRPDPKCVRDQGASEGQTLKECPLTLPCTRAPVLAALEQVREVSKKRLGMAVFVRNCPQDDELIDISRDEVNQKRWCFASGSKVDACTCLTVQKAFGEAITQMYESEENRTQTAKVHNATLPMKIFFLFVVLVVGLLLAVRRRGIADHYADWVPKIERGVLVGAFAMLFLPVMNLAFILSSSLLYGNDIDSFYRNISLPATLLFGAWAMILLFFFFRDADKEMETVGRISGIIGSALAISNYDLIINYFVRFAGSGADVWSLGMLAALAVIPLIAIVTQPKGKRLPLK